MPVESLGRYRIDGELGRGAMGRVFLAFDPTIERRVAIKTIQIFASLAETERAHARESFIRGARAAGKLLHPGIVTVFDVGEADGVPYLAMEFVEGETLDSACRPDALLQVPIVVELVASVAEALGFAHERGIVHRDIKPANLMRVSDRAVKIMDFGLARTPAATMTHDGALVGTPNYMSPEQVRGEPLDGRTDLFSLGVVCYELLTGTQPFAGDSISSVLYRIVNEPLRDAPLQNSGIPAPLVSFLARALAKNRGDRFRDGRKFAEALRQAGKGAPPAVSPSYVPQDDPPVRAPASAARTRTRRSFGPWFAAAGAALAVIGAAAILELGPFTPPEAAMLTARVRTEPPGLAVFANGAPLPGDLVRFRAEGPFEILTATSGCREAKHRVDVADAGNEIVIVLEPTHAAVAVDASVPGARVVLNGQEAGMAPATLELDLCRDNTVEIQAEGYHGSKVVVPATATPLAARSAAATLTLAAIPMGRVLFPPSQIPLEYFVDGGAVTRKRDGLELAAGSHELRATNLERFVDIAATVDVPADGAVTPALVVPPMARLVVQTFPPNCRVALKRGGSAWRQLGDTPLRHELAAGRYVLRVEDPESGESREQEISLGPGTNAPIRVSFGRKGR